MKIDDRLAILAHAADLGLGCGAGACGSIALAMNTVLFEGKGEIVAAVNAYVWKKREVPVGHVGVRYRGIIWDGEGTFEGEEGLEEFLAWGMLDPDDLDFEDVFPKDPEKREVAAYEAILLTGKEAKNVAMLLDDDDAEGQPESAIKEQILRAAMGHFEGLKPRGRKVRGAQRGSRARRVEPAIPTLYHGTTREFADRLVRDGWRPSQVESGGQRGDPRFLYVTTGWEDALWFANQKGDDAVVEIHNVLPEFIGIDPEDGMEATVDAELRVAKILKLPAKLTLRASLDKSHFRRFVRPKGSRARPNVALTPQVLTDPGDYFHPDARRFTWTPPPTLPRENILATTFGSVKYASPAEPYGSPGFTAGAMTRNLSHRVAAQLAGGLQEVLPGVVPHLKSWTLQFTDKPAITAWTDPNQRQLRFGAHPLSAGMLLHEAVHVADSACYAGGGEDCFGGDAWASYDKRHPLGVFAAALRAVWKESGEDERLLDHKVRQTLASLPFSVTRALLRGEGVKLDLALEAISHQAGVPVRPATLRDAWERSRGPFGGVGVPRFLSLSGLPASASRALAAAASCLPVGIPIGLPEREHAAYRVTLTTKQVRSNTARYWMARHELLARYLDQYARQDLAARGRWVPPPAPGSLPESVLAELAPAGRAVLREVGWSR